MKKEMTKRVACGFVALSLAMTSLLGQNYTGEITHEDQRFEAVVGDWQNFYGSAVAVDGNWAVVGEHNKWRGGDSGDAHVGAVHFFERTPRGWVERQTVTPLDANRSDQFGRPVAISGDTAVVGVPNHDNGAISTGAVYVYTLANGVWSQTQKLEVRPHSSGFGLGIGLHGDSLIVGAPGDSLVAHWWGIAYAYERIAGTWTLVQVIQPEGFRPDLYSDLHFGYQVSLHGDLAMISTWDRDGHPGWTFGYGRQVVAYERIAGVWVQKEVIGDPAPFDPNSGAYDFGISTALSDGVLAVGAPRPSGFYPRNGKVSVFERQVDGSWLSTQELESSQPRFMPSAGSDYFGASVSMRGGKLLVGAPFAIRDSGDSWSLGQAYLFEKDGTGIWEETKVLRSTAVADRVEYFGKSVALTEDFGFVGDPIAWDANGISKGSAHVFEFDQGSTYCTGFWNSFVSMRMTGRLLASENRLSVLGSGFVPGQVALLLAATDSGYVVSPGGSLGSFCLGGQLARVSPGVADASGDLFFTVNTQAVPTNPAVAILPGETWYFQIWYRDQLFGASALFSEAIQVDFE